MSSFGESCFQLSTALVEIVKAANSVDATLLITGATGTGKSHLASQVHYASARGLTGRFSKINLATLSENLIESELFGHERGAFTSAESRRMGRFEASQGGTVFLDEIGELSPRLQAKLLDFIQYKRFTPVGGNREIEVDVRIIAATNRDLEEAVERKEFRADLFHRLNVFRVNLPELSLSPQSVLVFARLFLKDGKRLSESTEKVLLAYSWPGNIRELQNTIEYACAISHGNEIETASLPMPLKLFAEKGGYESAVQIEETQKTKTESGSSVELPLTISFHESKDHFERAFIEQALRWCGGQINLTSRKTGLNKVSLTEKIRRYQIDWKKIRQDSLGPTLRSHLES